MTGFAVDYRADRVSVASDSLCYDEDGVPVGLSSKVHALPTLRCLMFSCGKVHLHSGAFAHMLLAPQVQTFEDASRELPAILNALTTQHDLWPDDPAKDVHRLMLMGWSAAEGRMRAVQFNSSDAYAPHSEFELRYSGPLPWPHIPIEYLPLDRSADSLEVKSVNIVAALDKFCLDHPADVQNIRLAGPIVLTVLTETEITRKQIGSLPSEFDEVEAPADPESVQRSHAATPQCAMTRQQRRSAERAAKKGMR